MIYRCDQSPHPDVPCSRCQLVTGEPAVELGDVAAHTGRAVGALRRALDIGYDDLARTVGISTQRLGAAETGAEQPTTELLLALVEGLTMLGRAARSEDEWAVFCGDPTEVEDIVQVFDELAEAEELAQRVIDARIGHRRLTIAEPPWTVLERCSSCGSVLDGALCCDGRAAEIEAGEAVLREAAEHGDASLNLPVLDHLHDIDAGGNCRDRQCGFNSDVENYR